MTIIFVLVSFKVWTEKPSPFETNNSRLFTIMSIVAPFVDYLQISSVKDIHNPIFKSIGCLSAILACISLVMVVLKFDWFEFAICATFFVNYSGMKGALPDPSLQQDNKSNGFPIIGYTVILAPLSLLLVLFVPHSLNWICIMGYFFSFWSHMDTSVFSPAWKPLALFRTVNGQ